MSDSREFFTTMDLWDEFRDAGHNQRTRNAFDHGVKLKMIGGRCLYQESGRDYADAELSGFAAAERRVERLGQGWMCDYCRMIHGLKGKGEKS